MKIIKIKNKNEAKKFYNSQLDCYEFTHLTFIGFDFKTNKNIIGKKIVCLNTLKANHISVETLNAYEVVCKEIQGDHVSLKIFKGNVINTKYFNHKKTEGPLYFPSVIYKGGK